MTGMIELLILAGIAVFLLVRLRGVLGARTGYEGGGESAPRPAPDPSETPRIDPPAEGVIDPDSETVAEGREEVAQALSAMRRAEPDFLPSEFVQGARQAFEMLLMAYEEGDRATLERFMSPELYSAFAEALDQREADGLSVESRFIGVREAKVAEARFEPENGVAEIALRFVGELITTVRDAEGRIVEGDPNEIRRETALWTFQRRMGSGDPNWTLIATGD